MLILRKFRMKHRRRIFQIFNFMFFFMAIFTVFFLIFVVLDIFYPGNDFIMNHLQDICYKNTIELQIGPLTELCHKNATEFHAAVILIFTIVIILGGWRQIRIANKIAKDDTLLRLDIHYSSQEIIKARTIIHKIYVSFGDDKIPRTYKIMKTAEEIEKRRTSEDPKHSDVFMYLVNFLDTLETIALFYNKGSIDETDLEMLTGESMKFYRDIFSCFIKNRRISTNNPSYYSELDKCIASLHH